MEASASDNRQWYAIYTRSRTEKKVYDYLVQRGIAAYLPIRQELHKWSDRKKLVEVPVINSYCFVYIDIKTEQVPVYNAPGFVAFVMHERRPVPIPQREIDLMKQAVDSKLAIEIENHTLRKGKRVRVVNGPMAGTIGVVESLGDKSVKILLTVVGITMNVRLNNDSVFEEVADGEE